MCMDTKVGSHRDLHSSPSATSHKESVQVQVIHDNLTFDNRQAMRLKEMEKYIQEETKKKKRDWEKDVEHMREEFLCLYPVDKLTSLEECSNEETETRIEDEDLVAERRGSTDVLDNEKMKSMILEYPDSGRRYKLRFNVTNFDPQQIKVTTDGERIIVRAKEKHEGQLFERKIEKPKEVDHTKLKSCLTTDGILIVEAPLPPKTLALRKTNHPSPSRSTQGISNASSSIRTASPIIGIAGSPSASPLKKDRRGIVWFRDDEVLNKRVMSLTLDIGLAFAPKEITAMIIKENRIQIKARHEERTPEKLSKSKYSKEFELSEKIESYSLRGGLTSDGRLIVYALCKGQADGLTKVSAGELMAEAINNLAENVPCSVLDLSTFPPTTPQIIANSYNGIV